MFLTYEFKDKGQDVALIFQGAGTRWPAEITKPSHPANALYNAVADKIVGVCGGCADVFGASDEVQKTGLAMVRDKSIPGTTGILDLSRYLNNGYQLVTF